MISIIVNEEICVENKYPKFPGIFFFCFNVTAMIYMYSVFITKQTKLKVIFQMGSLLRNFIIKLNSLQKNDKNCFALFNMKINAKRYC
jgi:hypothetical protein